MMLISSVPAYGHYETDSEKTDHKLHHHRASKIRPTKTTSNSDPWKLLELALTPACAASTNVNLSRDGYFRVLTSNGIPNHATGAFPNPGNPNTISEQRYTFRMLLDPKENEKVTPLFMYPFGVAINGIPFDPGANEWYRGDRNSGWQYEAMALDGRLGIDQNNAHVQPDGAYHYHGLPTGLINRLSSYGRPVLLGYAADGFPIYAPTGFPNKRGGRLRASYRIKSGQRAANSNGISPGGSYDGSFVQDYEYVKGLGDLDEANGKHAITAEYPRGTYLYVITDSYPYIPRAFRGSPDESFKRRGRTGAPPGGGYGHPGGQVRGFGPPPGGGYGQGGGPQGGMPPHGRMGPPPGGFGPPGGMGPPPGGFGPPGGMGPPPGGMGPPPGGMGPPGSFSPDGQGPNGTLPSDPMPYGRY